MISIFSSAAETVFFSNTAYDVNENGGVGSSGAVILTRTASAASCTATVSYTAGTASFTSDYTMTSTAIGFGVGETSKTVTLAIVDDTAVEGPEALTISISGVSGSCILGTTSSATITINDNDGKSIYPIDKRMISSYHGFLLCIPHLSI